MGFCYQVSAGRRLLCCDSCGHAGGVRKHRCPAGYCQAWALCSSCWARRSELGWFEAHEGCAAASAEYAALEARRDALLAEGAFVRTAAVYVSGDHSRALVWFRNAAGEERKVEMSSERYASVPTMEPATYARFFPADHAAAWDEMAVAS